MKYIFILFTILISFNATAQQDELLNHTWYLQKVIVDDVEYDVPEELIAEEVDSVLEFSATDSGMNYMTNVCLHILNGHIQSVTDTTLTLVHESETLANCSFFNQTFEFMYFDVFIPYNFDQESDFTYTIVEEDNILTLTLTNTENNQAIYTAEVLVVDDVNTAFDHIQLYPNPVKDELVVKIGKISEQYSITLSNLNGKLILHQEINDTKTELDLSSLPNGVYILNILKGKKTIQAEKIIKN